MDLNVNVLLEYCPSTESELFIVREKGGQSKIFSSSEDFLTFLRGLDAALSSK